MSLLKVAHVTVPKRRWAAKSAWYSMMCPVSLRRWWFRLEKRTPESDVQAAEERGSRAGRGPRTACNLRASGPPRARSRGRTWLVDTAARWLAASAWRCSSSYSAALCRTFAQTVFRPRAVRMCHCIADAVLLCWRAADSDVSPERGSRRDVSWAHQGQLQSLPSQEASCLRHR